MLFSFLFCSSYLSIIKLYILFRLACFYFCKNEIKVQLRFRCFVLSKNIFLSTFNRIRAKAFCFFQFLEREKQALTNTAMMFYEFSVLLLITTTFLFCILFVRYDSILIVENDSAALQNYLLLHFYANL